MKSMTGYGVAEGRVGNGTLFVEVRTVNHRYLDIQIKTPHRLNSMEPHIRKLIQDHISRGSVEIFLREKRPISGRFQLDLDMDLAKQYKKCLGELEKTMGIKRVSHLLEVVDLKELINFSEVPVDVDQLHVPIKRMVEKALIILDNMRKKEGKFIARDQVKRLRTLGLSTKRLKGRADKLARVRMVEIEEQIPTGDVSEELTRLESHISQYMETVRKEGPIGRKCDFLIQEMQREVNTIGSKACDSLVSRLVVDCKVELEKLKEQVQNIE